MMLKEVLMNRKNSFHFENLPVNKKPKSRFDLSFSNHTSFNAGDLVPILIQEILPGDDFTLSTSSIIRLTTLIDPIMDSLYCQIFYFFVPNRLLWNNWENFLGAPADDPYDTPTTYSVPQISAPVSGWSVNTLADYFGVPVGIPGININALPFRAYCKIVNEWFRDERVNQALQFSLDDATIGGSNGKNQVVDCVKGGCLFKVNKFHDLFTSCSLEPQAGDPVTLPIGGEAPVIGSIDYHTSPIMLGWKSSGEAYDANTSHNLAVHYLDQSDTGYLVTMNQNLTSGFHGPDSNNWVADMSQASSVPINDFLYSLQIQRYLELNNRMGTRYNEFLLSHFGVLASDRSLDRSQFLGSSRFNIDVNQVIQTSETTDSSPLGDTGAYSVTANRRFGFSASFEEHGYLIGLCCIRYPHSYSQGLNKLWSRKEKLDFYDPLFANIGEQPIYNKEIFCKSSVSSNDEVFGYNEAWIHYRYNPNIVTSEMRPGVPNSLASWNLADHFDSVPSLSTEFLQEDLTNVDRVIRVSHTLANQFKANFYFNIKANRVMPIYSIPKIQL